ncbi:hypothetical protein T552_02011 [Pneumocystis carinii B80]|uniref:Uncharacterized protein n=1 Tax=Pneumocystis carinii (strain B80) TaxID=1408658 RepID=A0A0W4ZIG1_PNEC8|nr:hypothetical protein T552_02011 [Pneumocystis carinii B80]KTW28152.1 hypothetical protein T552_02011 [Pneumocystis carinii B80]
MDMSSLHNHLPGRRKETKSEQDDLLSTFKAAALSVTNLYRQALTAAGQERQEGFQDAVEEMLMLLNDGITDIESLREWCIARRRNEGNSYSSSNFSEESNHNTSCTNSLDLNFSKPTLSSSPTPQCFQNILTERTETLYDSNNPSNDENISFQLIDSPRLSTKHRIIFNDSKNVSSKKCRHF